MTLKHLIRVVVVGTLLSFTAQLLAQANAMETRQGWRHVNGGGVSQSASTFAVGMTRDNGASYISSASVSETVEIRGEIRPEPANIGLPADIFIVDRLVDSNGGHISFSMRSGGVWLDWDGTFPKLLPFQKDIPLSDNHPITMFSGTLGTAGNHRIFLGYRAPDGIVRYHASGGLPVTITEAQTQSPLVQATALFEARIAPNIVSMCVSCHADGNPIAGHLHTFIGAGTSASLSADFTTFRSLLASRGKAFILNYVGGVSLHQGGQVVPQGTQNYTDLSQFLTLLEQL
jgi:hypothetical protein